jgi:outer membrane lipoprotein-sorting protein
MKKAAYILIVSVITLFPALTRAVTGDEAVEKFKARYYSITSMKGVISITYSSGEVMTGAFRYASGKFAIKFSSPSGKEIVTNGRKLWVYDKGNNVCGVQDVDGSPRGGIAGLLNGYMAIASQAGASDTMIKLKSPDKTYRDITLVVDATYMVKKAVFRNEKGDGFTVTFSNILMNESVSPGSFDFNVPANAQVVKNPLDVR